MSNSTFIKNIRQEGGLMYYIYNISMFIIYIIIISIGLQHEFTSESLKNMTPIETICFFIVILMCSDCIIRFRDFTSKTIFIKSK